MNFMPSTVVQIEVKELSLYLSQVAHQAKAHPGFHSMRQLGVFLILPEWDASPPQGCFIKHYIRWYPFINLGGERHCES